MNGGNGFDVLIAGRLKWEVSGGGDTEIEDKGFLSLGDVDKLPISTTESVVQMHKVERYLLVRL